MSKQETANFMNRQVKRVLESDKEWEAMNRRMLAGRIATLQTMMEHEESWSDIQEELTEIACVYSLEPKIFV